MTQDEDDRERALLAQWNQAERNAQRGDNSAIVDLLRSISHDPSEEAQKVPNLCFVADVLEGKFTRRRGRPSRDKIATDDDHEAALSAMWKDAVHRAERGNNDSLIGLLRSLSLRFPSSDRTHEVPNLWFVADLLDGRFRKRRGRPRSPKIARGIEEIQIANAVESTRVSEGVSIETAVAKVTEMLPRLESKTQKSYYRAKKAGLIKTKKKTKSE